MKHINYENLKTFADQVKLKYATKTALETLGAMVKTLEDAGAQANVLEGVKVNGVAQAIADKIVDIIITAGTANGTLSVAGVDVAIKGLADLAFKAKVSQADLDDALATAFAAKADKATSLAGYGITDAYTKSEIDGKISSVYKPVGSVAFAGLPAAAEAILGNVYNVTDKFTTTDNFVEGAGAKHPAGTNVVVVSTGEGTYGYDVLAGFVDLSGYVEKDGSKVLSTEDFTTELKTKLEGVAEGATNVEASETNGNVKINGVETPVYALPNDVLHTSDFETVTEAEIIALLADDAEEGA